MTKRAARVAAKRSAKTSRNKSGQKKMARQKARPSAPVAAKPSAMKLRLAKAAPKAAPMIGAVLRARRQSLNLTIDAVAAAAELTKGFLSDIERDKASPSVASLVRLCDVLNMPVGSLFSSVGSAVIRRDERTRINFGGSAIQDYLLTPTSAVKGQAIFSDFAPGGTGGEALYTLRCEEEFIFVLIGSLTILVDGEEIVLRAGDAMTFDPRRPHTFRNNSQTRPAQALFMLMPPSR